ncbi:MAG TPA: response regulator transcription factor [Chitinophagaceae bacterium]|nr:response regulator transcription factor [Chitinophagaceae bacterium]
MTNQDITVLIADDHEIFRDGLSLVLLKAPGIRLLGEAENGRELLNLVHQLRPDIVLTDLKMPVMDGIEATREICIKYPGTGVIALSMFDEDEQIMDMLEAGARGYLLKNAGKREIITAVNAVYHDGNYYCISTSQKLAALIAKNRSLSRSEKMEFSSREKEIILLICRQFTAKQIAGKLFLSSRTVEGHRTRILEKMKVRNTAGVVIYALKHNLVTEKDLLER